MRVFERFLKESGGATAVEYSLVAGFIFLAIVLTMVQVGGAVESLYQTISDGVTSAL